MSGPYKVVVVGESSVGKNELLWKIKSDKVPGGAGNHIRKTCDIEGVKVWLNIHNPDVDEKLFKVSRENLDGANAVLLIYDTTDLKTFNNLSNWHKSIKQSITPGTLVMAVGNRCDQITKRKVYKDVAEKFTEDNGMICRETKKDDFEKLLTELATLLVHKP